VGVLGSMVGMGPPVRNWGVMAPGVDLCRGREWFDVRVSNVIKRQRIVLRSVSTPASCAGGPGFKSRPGDRLSCLRFS
jgi:hypothetical protein